jgi:two-component system sensor histidine kinase YesM
VSAFTYTYYLGDMTQKLIASRILVLSEMSRNVSQLLKNTESVGTQVRFNNYVQSLLLNNSEGYENSSKTKQAISMMEKIIFSSDDMASIYVIPEDYRQNYYLDTVGFRNKKEMMDYPWYRDFDKKKNISFWVPERINEKNAIIKEYIITYVAPVLYVSNYEVMGHVAVSLKEEALHKILYNNNMEKNEKITLINNEKQVFYSSDRFYTADYRNSKKFTDISFEKKFGDLTIGKGKDEMLVTYAVLPDKNWVLVSEIPRQEFTKSINGLNNIIYLIILLCISASAGLAAMLYRSITKPLGALAVSIGNMGDGDFSKQVYDRNTKNEILKIYGNFNRMTARVANLMDRNSQIARQKKDAEFKALQAQINPHFLYNTLDAINWLAMLNNQEEISEMVRNLSAFFRNTLSDGKQIVTIEEELKQIEVYLKIERFRYKNRFDVEYNLDKRLLGCYTLKFILQPFVENCLIHGFRERSGQGKIIIQLFCKGERVFFEIIDDGRGMTDKQIEKVLMERTEGYGVMNVDERIRMKYGRDYGVTIAGELGKGTKVSICIPRIDHIQT